MTLEERVLKILEGYDNPEKISLTEDGCKIYVSKRDFSILRQCYDILSSFCVKVGGKCEECPFLDSAYDCGALVSRDKIKFNWFISKLKVIKDE